MTVREIEDRLALIREEAAGNDDEAAHCMEDRLYYDVLHAIKNGAGDASGLAAKALQAHDIEFARWCA